MTEGPVETLSLETSRLAAVTAWCQALGEHSVEAEPSRLQHWGRTTARNSPQPLAVLRVRSTAEVAVAAEIAHRFRVPIYPVSRGKNWGQGDACPVQEGQVALDLSGMDRIVEVNSELAYSVVEPGVTQGQLARHLEGSDSVMLDVTASAADSSLLGNYIERGDGFSPCGDRFANCCGMQVVLADGTVVETGYGRFAQGDDPGCRHLSRWGAGPSLDGLFSQSNLGIVTRLGIWLVRKPEQVLGFFASVAEPHLPELLARLRELHLAGVLQSPVHLYNAIRVTRSQAPIETPDKSHKPPVAGRFALFRDWNLWGGFYGDRSLCQARLGAARRQLRGLCRVHAVTQRRLQWLSFASQALRVAGMEGWGARGQALAASGLDGMDKLLGRPSDNAVRSVCARFAGEAAWDETRPADLRDYNVGLYWVTHLCPTTREKIAACLEVALAALERFRIEPHLTLTLISARVALCNITLYYDRTCPLASQAADDCRAELTGKLIAAGYPPYRVGIHGMEMVNSIGASHQALVRRIKSALDPHNVLAPGRYVS